MKVTLFFIGCNNLPSLCKVLAQQGVNSLLLCLTGPYEGRFAVIKENEYCLTGLEYGQAMQMYSYA